jgi:hypothetical protein
MTWTFYDYKEYNSMPGLTCSMLMPLAIVFAMAIEAAGRRVMATEKTE